MKPEQWIVNGEVGTSSRTIWAVMMGAVLPERKDSWDYGVPHDPDDFSRCYKLLTLFPEWHKRLPEVAEVFPAWVGFVREWDKLEKMYPNWLVAIEKYHQEKRIHPRKARVEDGMYEFMKTLEDEGRLADGWILDSPGSWHKAKPEGGVQ